MANDIGRDAHPREINGNIQTRILRDLLDDLIGRKMVFVYAQSDRDEIQEQLDQLSLLLHRAKKCFPENLGLPPEVRPPASRTEQWVR